MSQPSLLRIRRNLTAGAYPQLGGRPKPFTRERLSGGVVNQTDQIEFVGHRRELTADGLQSDKESTVEHRSNFAIEVGCRTMDFQRAVSSVLTDCLSLRAPPISVSPCLCLFCSGF